MLVVACVGLARADDFFTYSGKPLYQKPNVVAADAATDAITGALRVASYNIEHFTDAVNDGADRTPEAAQAQAGGAAGFIGRIHPDLIVLQEIEGEGSVRLLNSKLAKPFPQALVTRFGEGAQNEEKLNIAALARVPLLQACEIDFGKLTGPGRPTRGVLRFQVDLGEQRRLLVYAFHLKSNFGNKPRNIAQREATTRIIAEDAASVRGASPDVQWETIAMGDANVDPESAEFATDTSLKPFSDWVDLWHGIPLAERATCPTRVGDPATTFPPVTFDRIFVSPSLTNAPWIAARPGVIQEGCATNDSSILPGTQGHVSDHYPVFVDLQR